MLPWLDVPTLERSPLRAHCEILDEIEIPMLDSEVRAGLLTEPSVPYEPKRVVLTPATVRGSWLSDVGVGDGDTVYVNTEPIGRLSVAELHGEIVLVRTCYGPQLGRYLHGKRWSCLKFLDGSGFRNPADNSWEIIGVVSHVGLYTKPGEGRDGKYGETF